MDIGIFPFVVAALPVATYFLLLGTLRCLRRPLVTSGSRDLAAVAVAVSGLIVMGPLHLFFPSTAAAQLGWLVWLVLGMLYVLFVALILFSLRPSIVAYGIRIPQGLPLLLRAARHIDPAAISLPESSQVVLPTVDVRLRIEPLGITDAVQIEAFERNLQPRFWRSLLAHVRSEAIAEKSAISVGGLSMFLFGSVLMTLVVLLSVGQSEELIAGLRAWLQ